MTQTLLIKLLLQRKKRNNVRFPYNYLSLLISFEVFISLSSLSVFSTARSTRWPAALNWFFLMLPLEIETNPQMLNSSNYSLTSCLSSPVLREEDQRDEGGLWGGYGGGGLLSHNEASGFVSSLEDLVNPELCRAALHRKERPAGVWQPALFYVIVFKFTTSPTLITPHPRHPAQHTRSHFEEGSLWRKKYFHPFSKVRLSEIEARELFMCVYAAQWRAHCKKWAP